MLLAIKLCQKINNQFAHPPATKLISLLKDTNTWSNEFHADIEKTLTTA